MILVSLIMSPTRPNAGHPKAKVAADSSWSTVHLANGAAMDAKQKDARADMMYKFVSTDREGAGSIGGCIQAGFPEAAGGQQQQRLCEDVCPWCRVGQSGQQNKEKVLLVRDG